MIKKYVYLVRGVPIYSSTVKRLGDVQLLAETTTPAQPDFLAQDKVAFARAGVASPVPLDAGTSQVSVSVRIRWSLA